MAPYRWGPRCSRRPLLPMLAELLENTNGGTLMKVVIAPDSFKGSRSSTDVAADIEKGLRRVFPDAQVVKLPIADGGEGTVEAFLQGAGGTYHHTQVAGPMGAPVTAQYGVLPDGTAVIEMAAAAGLPLVPEEQRNPLHATTYGVGQLMLAALDRGCRRMIVGLGGSATNDGGIGMARALGVSFLDGDGRELAGTPDDLLRLADVRIQGMDPRITGTAITLASDVRSPLCGPRGASAVFGPQKGADPAAVQTLDAALAHLAAVVQEKLGVDCMDTPGAGAAGGLGYGLMAFCGARMQSGIQAVMEHMDMDRHLEGCSLVITGEGRLDGQSAFGKVPVGVAQRAKERGIPVLAIVGGMGDGAGAVYDCGVDSIMTTVNRAMPLEEAMADAGRLLEDAAERAMRIIRMGMGLSQE